jgi:hypothetical protein
VNTTRNAITAPAMSRADYDELPEIVRRFIPWEKARQPVTVKPVEPPAKATRLVMYSRIARKAGR